MAHRSSLIPLPDILACFLKTHGMHSHLVECSLQQHWPTIVGAQVGHHTWPEAIRHRTLYLLAENSVWLQHLRFLKPELLAKITAYAGSDALTDIVLRVGIRPSPEGVLEGRTKQAAPSDREPAGGDFELGEAVRAAIEASVRPVADPELRERLRMLFTKSASAAPS